MNKAGRAHHPSLYCADILACSSASQGLPNDRTLHIALHRTAASAGVAQHANRPIHIQVEVLRGALGLHLC
jgi:hypothetical protein